MTADEIRDIAHQPDGVVAVHEGVYANNTVDHGEALVLTTREQPSSWESPQANVYLRDVVTGADTGTFLTRRRPRFRASTARSLRSKRSGAISMPSITSTCTAASRRWSRTPPRAWACVRTVNSR